jgi:hypothetical protein
VGDTKCPYCGCELGDGETVAGRRNPGHNDLSICRNCGEILILERYGSELRLRPATASEYLDLSEKAQTVLRVAYELVRGRQRAQRLPRRLN